MAAPATARPTPAAEPVGPDSALRGRPEPSEVNASFAVVREWVTQPAESRDSMPSSRSVAAAPLTPPFNGPGDHRPTEPDTALDGPIHPAAPSAEQAVEQQVSVTIGAIDVIVEAPSTPITSRPERPARQRSSAPSAIEARRAQRR
jgi:hypothetical protein